MCVTVLSVLGLVYAAGCGARLPTATVVIYAPPSLRLGECRRRFGRRHSTSREHDTKYTKTITWCNTLSVCIYLECSAVTVYINCDLFVCFSDAIKIFFNEKFDNNVDTSRWTNTNMTHLSVFGEHTPGPIVAIRFLCALYENYMHTKPRRSHAHTPRRPWSMIRCL